MRYTDEQRETIVKNIFYRMTLGQSVNVILRSEDMPDRQTFYNWLDEDKSLFDRYARAKIIRAHYIFDEILEIADNTDEDTLINNKGQQYENKEWVNRSRLKVDARKWELSKMLPKEFGDKMEINGETTQNIVWNENKTYDTKQ